MRFLNFLLITTLTALFSCTVPKSSPEYVGQDKRVKPYYEEFTRLAMNKGIIFNNDVTVGFQKISEINVIGICTYGKNWREVDIDEDFWNKHYDVEKKILVFHELTHCFCGRPHDHDTGQLYLKSMDAKSDYKSDGYFPDGCPKSIMAPVIAKPYCLDAYYDYYIDEMFNRCEPW